MCKNFNFFESTFLEILAAYPATIVLVKVKKKN